MNKRTVIGVFTGLAGVALLAYIAFWAAVITIAVLVLQHFHIV
ncbi:MAG TPA: hypothetical protein VFJ78_09865 [Gaiellaceae bacterium]|nr:hypothetical protein [Gaiellaceae bacterium]